MASIVVRIAIQMAVTLAALLGAEYSILNWLTGSSAALTESVTIQVWNWKLLEGPRQEVEVGLRIAIVMTAFLVLFLHEAVTYWLPKQALLRFRKEYIDLEKDEWRKKLHPDIRINLMHVKHRWYALWLPVFEWTWNDGFAPHHEDANMWMCAWQGACGKAYRSKRPQFASLEPGSYKQLEWYEKWLLMNPYHLTKRQLRKTRHLTAVLSIPIVRKTEGLSPVFRRVGVINLDTETASGADLLRDNQQELAEFFLRFGKIFAALKV